MRVLILGAAGQIATRLIDILIEETDHELVLLARRAHQRLSRYEDLDRVKLVDGDMGDEKVLTSVLEGVDIVYNNSNSDVDSIDTVIQTMKKEGIDRLLQSSAGGVYQELPEAFQKWNDQAVAEAMKKVRVVSRKVEESDLNYTLLRYLWLYDGDENENYETSPKGEMIEGTQITRQACARFIADIIENPDDYSNQSIGMWEPGTEGNKPEFYR